MKFALDAGLAVLTRPPATLRALLAGLPVPWTSATEGPDTWSPQDVVGHLIHGEETDWIPRAKIDRKSTRLNSSHVRISYAVFCLKKKKYDASAVASRTPGRR